MKPGTPGVAAVDPIVLAFLLENPPTCVRCPSGAEKRAPRRRAAHPRVTACLLTCKAKRFVPHLSIAKAGSGSDVHIGHVLVVVIPRMILHADLLN